MPRSKRPSGADRSRTAVRSSLPASMALVPRNGARSAPEDGHVSRRRRWVRTRPAAVRPRKLIGPSSRMGTLPPLFPRVRSYGENCCDRRLHSANAVPQRLLYIRSAATEMFPRSAGFGFLGHRVPSVRFPMFPGRAERRPLNSTEIVTPVPYPQFRRHLMFHSHGHGLVQAVSLVMR